MLWEVVAVFAAVFAVAYLYVTRNFQYWAQREVPYVKPLPFLGNVKDLFLLRYSSGGFLADIYKKMAGKPYAGFFIFDRPALLLRDPSLIKKVLIKEFHYFGDRFTNSDIHVDPLGYKNLFVIKGEAWKYLRSKLSPAFTSGRMKQMFHLVAECDMNLVNYIGGLVDKDVDGTIDVKEVTAKCTTDVISSCAFGISSNSLQDPKAEFREFGKKAFDYTLTRALEITVFFFAPFFVKLANLCFFQRDANDFLRKVFWDTINLRESSNVKRNDVIELLIQLKNKGDIDVEEKDKSEVELFHHDQHHEVATKFDFNGDDLVAQAGIFFLAGFETTASAISFTLYEMALNPELQKKLREEIAGALKENNGQITYEMVFSLKYLDMVLSETLRKYPPLPFLDRVALKDYHDSESGLVIEKGTPVYIPMYGLHTDPQYHPDPQRYDPERFSAEGKKKQTPFTYFPFGEGPHNCIGMRFGLMSAKTGVVHVLSRYEVEPSDETPIPLMFNTRGIVITTKGGVPLRFKKSNVI